MTIHCCCTCPPFAMPLDFNRPRAFVYRDVRAGWKTHLVRISTVPFIIPNPGGTPVPINFGIPAELSGIFALFYESEDSNRIYFVRPSSRGNPLVRLEAAKTSNGGSPNAQHQILKVSIVGPNYSVVWEFNQSSGLFQATSNSPVCLFFEPATFMSPRFYDGISGIPQRLEVSLKGGIGQHRLWSLYDGPPSDKFGDFSLCDALNRSYTLPLEAGVNEIDGWYITIIWRKQVVFSSPTNERVQTTFDHFTPLTFSDPPTLQTIPNDALWDITVRLQARPVSGGFEVNKACNEIFSSPLASFLGTFAFQNGLAAPIYVIQGQMPCTFKQDSQDASWTDTWNKQSPGGFPQTWCGLNIYVDAVSES